LPSRSFPLTIIADGCVYTVEEFALTVINDRSSQG
jgi:hypothetical protein